MLNLGNQSVGAVLPFPFTTNAATGAAVAPSSAFEAADIRIYKNGGGTERSSSAGITMSSPFDAITGGHMVLVDTGDNTDTGFYSAGSFFSVWLVPDETVDSVAVAVCLGTFQLEVGRVEQAIDDIAALDSGLADVDDIWLGAPQPLLDHLEGIVRAVIAASSTTTAIKVDSIALGTTAAAAPTSSPDKFVGRAFIPISGACKGEARLITDYSESGGVATFTVAAFSTSPADNDLAIIV